MATAAESPHISPRDSSKNNSSNAPSPIKLNHFAVDAGLSPTNASVALSADQNLVAGVPRQPPAPIAAVVPVYSSPRNGQAPIQQQSSPVDKDVKAEKKDASTSTQTVQIDDGDKPENGSLSTDNTQTQAQSLPRKVNKSSGALTSSSTQVHAPIINGNGKPKSARSSKPSFFSKLVRMFMPCVPCMGPSSRTHAIDIDKTVLPIDDPKEEKIVVTPVVLEKLPEPAVAPPEPSSVPPPDLAVLIPPAPIPSPLPLDPPPALTTAEIALPPTPTKTLLPPAETGGMTSGAVQPPGSTGEDSPRGHPQTHDHHRDHSRDSASEESDGTSFTEDDNADDGNAVDEAEDDEDRLITNGGAGIPIGPDGMPRPLLPPIAPQHAGRKCLVLDLDETLVHSSFKSISQADYVVPVEIEYHWHNVYVIKRPGVDNFLKKMGEIYEVVVFTASLSKYADPVLDKLDIHQVVTHRLFRESCYNHKGNYVKDLSQLGRPIADTIILDNSPASYIFHPNNAVPVSSWFNDPHDTELTDLVPFLADLSPVDDVRGVLDGGL